jgi:hypothetical protein
MEIKPMIEIKQYFGDLNEHDKFEEDPGVCGVASRL